MKKIPLLLSFLMISSAAFAKITIEKNQLYIETNSVKAPLLVVNQMLKEKSISNLKTYEKGNIHLVSFAKKDGAVKLYSVDEKGFIYDIAPFSSYSVSSTDEKGRFEFAEIPNRKYTISPKGFYLY